MISDLQKPIDSGYGQKTEPNEILNGIDLNGKTIIVTGGYSGIGLETTRALKKAGGRVIVLKQELMKFGRVNLPSTRLVIFF